MLRKIRLTLAILFFTLITLLFLDFTGTMHAWFGWMAKIQFLPAVLALNVGVIVLLIALTLVLGRVYCSVICPLGVFQDVISWISGRRKKKKYRFSWSPAKSWLRYSVLALFILALIAGIGSFVALLAPYSSYGRVASNLFAPVYRWGNNLLAYVAERADSYAFYETDVWMKSLPTFIIAVLTFIIIGVLAWRNGRTLVITDYHRYGQMQRLRTVFAKMQGGVHQRKGAHRGLQPLRGVHGLHRYVPARSHQP